MKIFRATWQIDRPSEPQIEILSSATQTEILEKREREREENTKDCMK